MYHYSFRWEFDKIARGLWFLNLLLVGGHFYVSKVRKHSALPTWELEEWAYISYAGEGWHKDSRHQSLPRQSLTEESQGLLGPAKTK